MTGINPVHRPTLPHLCCRCAAGGGGGGGGDGSRSCGRSGHLAEGTSTAQYLGEEGGERVGGDGPVLRGGGAGLGAAAGVGGAGLGCAARLLGAAL